MGRATSGDATGRESVVELGRRIVGLSAKIPREALRFLRSPRRDRHRRPAPGAAPGEMVVPPHSPRPAIHVMVYDDERLSEHDVESGAALRELVAGAESTVWIDVEGLGDPAVLAEIGEVLDIHPLAMADVVHVPQRPKAEAYGDRVLVVSQQARMSEVGELEIDQVSLVLGPGWVVSFQEHAGDLFDPIRERLRSQAGRIRGMGPDYLAYSLLDAVIDSYFPVIEVLGAVVDALEEEVVGGASQATMARIQATRRTFAMLHRVQWRQRDAIATLMRDEDLPFGASVKPFLRDAHDHAFQTLDMLETYRDMVVGLMDLYLSSTSHRINEVMKTLTIVATIFIPLTFLTGVYGMNFQHMPELRQPYAYPVLWLVMVGIALALLLWFHRRGWTRSEETSRD